LKIQQLEIEGVWKASSKFHLDDRGGFREWFKYLTVNEEIDRKFTVAQANSSFSRKGVIRGIHYSKSIGGQGKWITCTSGSIWDVVVDIRPKSTTFMKWVGIELNAESGDSVYVSEGLGHAFMALEEYSTIVYLLSSPYSPSEEHAINPFDTDLAITWPIGPNFVSTKDASAPSIKELMERDEL
jgi:dTDP-4-dehydrorhamnose 3,5-epimerase